ncbi:MAG: M14 family metallopeptidase [Alphaproteobacteria bacterium]|nr:M14 family metallopeptidase [Alphaproteobacteria bacterium]
MMDATTAAATVFSTSYEEARSRFLDAAHKAGAGLERFDNPNPGPTGGTLSTDTAVVGDPDAPCLLVITSACHGVEGFTGSGAQLDWLLGDRRLPDGVAMLLVHAINPHGFAWHRRVTEEGCDLNRNFVDFSKPLPENPLYDEIADAIVPRAWTGPDRDAADAVLADAIARHGLNAVMAAMASGQHRHPTGIFYGGIAPTWSRQTFETIRDRHAFGARRHVCHIDIHTGLGQFGHGELITLHPPDSGGVERAVAWWGPSCAPMGGAGSVATPRTGLMPDAVEAVASGRYTFGALEFGTHPSIRGRLALRADHWLHAHSGLPWDHPTAEAIRAELTEFFFPVDPSWRELVVFRTRQVIGRALAGLTQV